MSLGKLYDEGLDGTDPAMELDGVTKKDVSRYHRIFKVAGRDAMGQSYVKRGFSDSNLFAAMTTQAKVPALEIENKKKCKWIKGKKICETKKICRKVKGKDVCRDKNKCKWVKGMKICEKIQQRWSYAIPLEIIYLTPLSRWNPYKLKYKGEANKDEGKTVTAGGRNGDCKDSAKSFNGTSSKAYYITPSAFFGGSEANRDAADTAKGTVCVLDQDGKSQPVRASGTRIFLPRIEGVGYLRTRYPIMPVHGEGSAVWKEVNALKDYILDPDSYKFMKYGNGDINQENTLIKTGVSQSSRTTQHVHEIELSPNERSQLEGGRDILKTSSLANGHTHDMLIRWDSTKQKYKYIKCGDRRKCWDNHAIWMEVEMEGNSSTMSDDGVLLDYTEPEINEEM